MIIDSWIEPYLVTANLLLGASGVLFYGAVAPASRIWGPNISHGPRHGPPRVALTFDDGPTPDSTERVLDILRELAVPATFFVIGRNAQKAPDLLRQIHATGHLIANHTFDHHHFAFLHGPRSWTDQIRRTDDLVGNLIGHRPRFFRPPLGVKTWNTARALRNTGHTMITWNRRAMDGIATTPPRILARLLPHASPGDILALHDGIEPARARDPAPTIAALGPLILGLRDRGLQIVPLDQLLGLAAYAD